MIIKEEDYLAHYGILRRSGRYPWGSGGPEFASNASFLGMVGDLKRQGLSEVQIAEGLNITTSELRKAKSIARNEEKQSQINQAQRLKEKGLSNLAIGRQMNINESSVRALLAPGQKDKLEVLKATSNMLRDAVAEKKYIDVGAGVDQYLGVTSNKLSTAVANLQEEGYKLYYVKIEQLGTGQLTTLKVLTAPGTPYSEVFQNRFSIQQAKVYSEDGGRSYTQIQPPVAISSKRVAVRYREEGGDAADGVIYVRPNVHDVSLGGSSYAQVRIAVDGTHYIKGMAIYKDDLPNGVDLMFNTNKSNTGNKLDALKSLKKDKATGEVDEDNPFGATVHQITDPKTGKVTSAMNLVNEEGNWDQWSKNLSSQFLSKQSPDLAKGQLAMTLEQKKTDLNEIMDLTNPAVRKKLLEGFADDADSSAVHLKAAALPRQRSQVILPIDSMKDNEVYAPNFRAGEKVVLVRYPHGGVFEIPELTVNNRQPEAKKILGAAEDAIGINSKVAARLSGADFDGDTVLVIPNNSRKVITAPALAGLKGFDPVSAYPAYPGMKEMTPKMKQQQMGVVSNLITDMTIKGATTVELAAAVRHSMVVIDAEKHNLDYKQSAIDNGIANLKAKYQGGPRAGAATLISKASSELRVPERKQGFTTDKETGQKVFKKTGASFVNSKGKVVEKKTNSTQLAETSDAKTLSSGTRIEKIYAEHSNALKALANAARKEAVHTKGIVHSPSATTAYSKEVASLNSKLALALRNAPLERQAQVIANGIVSQKKASNPDMESDELKKIKTKALMDARIRTGAEKQRIEINDAEWAAIQAGALFNSRVNQILDHADLDTIKKLATPKTNVLMTTVKQDRAKAMVASGYPQSEIADALGVSLTTLKKSLREGS